MSAAEEDPPVGGTDPAAPAGAVAGDGDGLALARDALAAARAKARAAGLRPHPAGGTGAGQGGAAGGGSSRGAGGRGGSSNGAGSGRRGTRRTTWTARHPDEPALSGSGPDARDPQLLRSALERLTAERGWSTELAVGGVLGRWEHVVGAEVAAHCMPETFDDGVLVVRTDSTAWATQVRLLAPTLVARLTEEVGPGVVRRVVVRGPVAPSWRKGGLHVRGRGPRDTYG